MTETPASLLAEARLEMESMFPGYALLIPRNGQTGQVLAALQPEAQAQGIELMPMPAEPAFRELNALRDWRILQGIRIVLLCEEPDLPRVRSEAPDLASGLQFSLRLPWLPVEVDPVQARAEYAAWLRARYGRLNLRGFARSEREDVSWELVQVYEEQRFLGSRTPWPLPDTWEQLRSDRTVVLGHPGAGKTFFLRWLALAGQDQDRLPLLAPLARFAGPSVSPDLFEGLRQALAQEGLSIAHRLEELARQGQVQFLLDGLDEAGEEGTRAEMVRRVQVLADRFPACPIVLSSRITGYEQAPLPVGWRPLTLEPFDDEQIRGFLRRWCRLYAEERLGASEQASREGEAEGELLARDVLAHPQVALLARTPLLLTVLAMVHRAGLRLPDHRVELYEHITRILVERWNRLRGLVSDARALPVQTADALRLLGPLALQAVRTGPHALIREEELRRACERTLESGRLRGLGSTDEVLRLFRDELGLLIEQGPGLWSFLHLTLAEYYAALELLRTEGLETLAKDPKAAFQPQSREILLLAAGELGIRRADDARLSHMVEALVSSAKNRPGRPSSVVPSVLAGLLADDPALEVRSARLLVEALVPTWWFERRYGRRRYKAVADEAGLDLGPRILAGRHGDLLREALRTGVFSGRNPAVVGTMGDAGGQVLGRVAALGRRAGLDQGALLRACLDGGVQSLRAALDAWTITGRLDDKGILVLHAPECLDSRLSGLPAVTIACVTEPWVRSLVLSRERFETVAVDGSHAQLRLGLPAHLRDKLKPGPVYARYRLPARVAAELFASRRGAARPPKR